MNRTINTDRRAPRWEHDTAMLASSMMLVSISEEQPIEESVGFKSRLSPSPTSTRNLLSGWGTAETRKSFKCDLNALADAAQESSLAPSCMAPQQHHHHHHVSSHHHNSHHSEQQGWGFYTGSDVYSRQR